MHKAKFKKWLEASNDGFTAPLEFSGKKKSQGLLPFLG